MAHGSCDECDHAESRKRWQPGPWDNEPDRVEFEHAGMACLLHRSNRLGNWCGYVGVRPDHPEFGQHYDDVAAEVHGGLTYAEKCSGAICHVPKPGEPDDLWWFGFDCAHGWDISPCDTFDRHGPYASYKDLAYVRKETESLAEQLAAMKTA